MNQPSRDIKTILESYGDSSGLNLDFSINLFLNKEPATPINCVTIFDTEGFPPYLGLGGETGYEYPSINIRVRNTKQQDAWTIIEEIKEALHGRHQETWNDTLYSIIYCSSGPALLDWDDNGNCRLIVNFNIQRRLA
jgi:hypothetical protein